MKKVFFAVFLAVLGFALMAGSSEAMCIQDQYGNQYDFTVDSTHKYLYGVMYSAQGCNAAVWYLTGSYNAGGGPPYELTAANPLGDGDVCVATYKIKGTYPGGAWYYTTGYGGQEFTFVNCGAPAAASVDPSKGGTRK